MSDHQHKRASRAERDATVKLSKINRVGGDVPRPKQGKRPASGVLDRVRAPSDEDLVDLQQAGAALAVCDLAGRVVSLSPSASRIFRSAGLATRQLPVSLPEVLWDVCRQTDLGHMAEWRPTHRPGVCIGFTPYRLGAERFLLLLCEIHGKQQEVSSRLHKQRLELTGRLVAMIAHDLRVPLSTILFNAEMACNGELGAEELAVLLSDVRASANRMRTSIEGLLDFAGPGGTRRRSVNLSLALDRLRSLLHPSLREGRHELQFHVDASAMWGDTNALLLEQVLVNLVMNAIEAATNPIVVLIEASLVRGYDVGDSGAESEDVNFIKLAVQDSGPGIPATLRHRVFDPFFSTKPHGTGLGLPMAREAMAAIGATLTLEASACGARFAIWLPAASRPTSAPPAGVCGL